MSEMNHSRVTKFILVGFPGLAPEYYGLLSAVFFLVYFFTVIGNGTVFFLFAANRCLHIPTYYIILNLTACDLLFSTSTLPKMISNYWFQTPTISFDACFVQMYLVHYLGSVNSFVLFLMAFDRYLAICHPLRYANILKLSVIVILSATAWIVATIFPLLMVIRAYPLPYCASNKIYHCYCDHVGITLLACTDRAPYSYPAFVGAMITLLCPLAFIVFSYCSILVAVSKIANRQSCIKSLSTCSTQLIIISLYYLPRCLVYLFSTLGITFNADSRILIIVLYSLAPPLVNPLIYCLRAKDMRMCLFRQFEKMTPRNTHIFINF